MIRVALLTAALAMVVAAIDSTTAAAQDGPMAARPADLRAAREALRAADGALSAAAEARGFAAGLAAALAEDAYVLREGAPLLHGRDRIHAHLAASPAGRLNWTTLRAGVSADGLHGYTFGGGTYTLPDGTPEFSRTLSYWRNEGGTWKVAAMVVNRADTPAKPAPAGFFPEDGAPSAPPASVSAASAATALDEVMQADRDFAAMAAAQNAPLAFRHYMAPDGAMLTDPVYGPDANYDLQKNSRTVVEWGPVAGGAAASGDLGFTIGVATFTEPDTGMRHYGKYLSVWRRQPNGEWRYVVDGGNARPASSP